jgi:hypothetical protein
MELTIEIVASGDSPPPAGAPVIVQIRDAGLQDVASLVVAEARGVASGDAIVARVQVEFERCGSPIVWAHVDVDESGDVTLGDFITMQSFGVRGEGAMRVEVRRV